MKRIEFSSLTFTVEEGKIRCNGIPFVELRLAGGDKNAQTGAKMVKTADGEALCYRSHTQAKNALTIVQESDFVRVRTHFTAYENTNAVRVYTEVENIGDEELALEELSAFVYGLNCPFLDIDKAELLRFMQSHHGECQPRKATLSAWGMNGVAHTNQTRIFSANVGSWSTKEELPQAIFSYAGRYTMFQIEKNHSWYYEISDEDGSLYLYLGGSNTNFLGWSKRLAVGEAYQTNTVTLCFSNSAEGAVCEMTKARRHFAGKCAVDAYLPPIFNEYMHLSWDSPSEEGVKKYAPVASKTGVEYYVIDCGWHDEVSGDIIYPYVGKWVESKARFSDGLRTTTDYIRSLGMKPGLWIEPEIVGKLCKEMIDYYGEECFLHRNGKKICAGGRYFLDFRKQRVVDYLTETIRRMVEDYGAEYIKLDYNEDMGVGVDGADSFGEGLEQCARAYLTWVDSVRVRFPNVLFETCSSGGMRMDYETLSHFSIVSTSDQIDYKKYPYIAANICAAALSEQAAVWSYPVGSVEFACAEWVQNNLSDEQIIMNMVNSFLGRMHLASHLEWLSQGQLKLVQEGVECYKRLSESKITALPVFPLGFATEEDGVVASGLRCGDKTYLAVWCLKKEGEVVIPMKGYRSAVCAYPKNNSLPFAYEKGELKITFTQPNQARFFELMK